MLARCRSWWFWPGRPVRPRTVREESRRCCGSTIRRPYAPQIAAWRQMRRELRTAPPAEPVAYTRPAHFMREPAVTEGVLSPTQSAVRGRDKNGRKIEARSPPSHRAHQPRTGSRVMRSGGDACRPRVPASRGTPTRPPPSSSACARRPPCGPAPARDPVAATGGKHLRASPGRRGQQVCSFSPHDGRTMAVKPRRRPRRPVLDLQAALLEWDQDSGASTRGADPARGAVPFAPLGFARSPATRRSRSGEPPQCLYNDFGPSSIDDG